MPRPRARSLFELEGQWIAREPGRRQLYRYWTDSEGTGRTRRASLGTTDLETAKRRLAEIVVRGAQRTVDAMLSIVLEDYFLARTDKLPSKMQSRNAGKVLLRHFGITARISDLTPAKQKAFVEEAVNVRGQRVSYAARNLCVLHAAVAHAGIPAQIIYSEAEIAKTWHIIGPPPKRTPVPSDQDLADLFNAGMPEPLFRWCILQMLTGGRAETTIDLAPVQRMRDAGVVDLNPPGRAQNKKVRPIVREPVALKSWLDKWEAAKGENSMAARGGRYCGYVTIEGVKSALERVAADAGVRITTRSFRHKVTTVLRQAEVSEDEIAIQLGHRRPDLRTTGLYGEWSPSYLRKSAAALDAWLARVQKLTNVSLYSHAKPATIRGRKTRAA